MYDHLLVPTDGSTGTAHVAMQAIDLAGQYDATLHVCNVVDDDVGALLTDIADSQAKLEAQEQRAVERVEGIALTHGVDVVTEVREGDPAEEILAYADEIAADAIVAGTHGRSGVDRHLVGSVAERLVRHATCPVMTIRLPETDETVTDESHARDLGRDALADADHEATIDRIDHQVSVWRATASTDDDATDLVVYIDPVTQRTSVVER